MNTTAAQAGQEASDIDALVQSLYNRLVESGGWNKLLKQLRTNLEDSEWEKRLNTYAKEQVIQHDGDIHLGDLLRLLQPQAKATIPPELKEQLLNSLRTFVSDNVEE